MDPSYGKATGLAKPPSVWEEEGYFDDPWVLFEGWEEIGSLSFCITWSSTAEF